MLSSAFCEGKQKGKFLRTKKKKNLDSHVVFYFKIYNNDHQEEKVLCGENLPNTINTTSGTKYLKFITNIGGGRGFKIQYTITEGSLPLEKGEYQSFDNLSSQ